MRRIGSTYFLILWMSLFRFKRHSSLPGTVFDNNQVDITWSVADRAKRPWTFPADCPEPDVASSFLLSRTAQTLNVLSLTSPEHIGSVSVKVILGRNDRIAKGRGKCTAFA